MGYYSQVSVVVGYKVASELLELKKNDINFPFSSERIFFNGTERKVVFSDEMKWYEGVYSEVDRFMAIVRKFLKETLAEDESNYVDYLRIGEEDGDEEHECNGFEVQYILREASVTIQTENLPEGWLPPQ